MARVTLYVKLDGNAVAEVRNVMPTESGSITGFHLMSEQEQEAHGWHKVSANLKDANERTERVGEIVVTFDPNRGFTVTRDVIPLTEDEIVATDTAYNATQRELRSAAMAIEADPLFMKFQRGEATRAQWLAAVEAIRNRYPYRS